MEQLALKLPDGSTITPAVKTGGSAVIQEATTGGVLSPLLNIVFLIAFVLMFVWMVWGTFQYIFAGGNKEALAKARSRITWAIVGFCIVLLAFTIQQWAKEIFPPDKNTPLTTVSEPPAL
jgi:hypothetical protein